MSELIKCLFGIHKYEIYKEEEVTDIKGNLIGKVIVSICTKCGKIKTNYIDKVKY